MSKYVYYISCMSKHEKMIADEIVKRLGSLIPITSSVTTHQTQGKQTKRGITRFTVNADLPGYIILKSDVIIPYHLQVKIQQDIKLVVGGQSKRVIYHWMDAEDERKLGLKKSWAGRNVYCASARVKS